MIQLKIHLERVPQISSRYLAKVSQNNDTCSLSPKIYQGKVQKPTYFESNLPRIQVQEGGTQTDTESPNISPKQRIPKIVSKSMHFKAKPFQQVSNSNFTTISLSRNVSKQINNTQPPPVGLNITSRNDLMEKPASQRAYAQLLENLQQQKPRVLTYIQNKIKQTSPQATNKSSLNLDQNVSLVIKNVNIHLRETKNQIQDLRPQLTPEMFKLKNFGAIRSIAQTESPKLKDPPKAYKIKDRSKVSPSPELIHKNSYPIKDKFYETLYKTASMTKYKQRPNHDLDEYTAQQLQETHITTQPDQSHFNNSMRSSHLDTFKTKQSTLRESKLKANKVSVKVKLKQQLEDQNPAYQSMTTRINIEVPAIIQRKPTIQPKIQSNLLMKCPANTKLTLIYIDGTHSTDHFKYQLLPCAFSGGKTKVVDIQTIFGGLNLNFDRKQFIIAVSDDRYILFGQFSKSLYQKIYVSIIHFLVAQNKLKKGPNDDLLFNLMIQQKQNYGVNRRIRQLEMKAMESKILLESFNQIVQFNSIHNYEVLDELPIHLTDHFITRQTRTQESILDSIPSVDNLVRKSHQPKFKKSKLNPKRESSILMNQTSSFELPILSGQQQKLTMRQTKGSKSKLIKMIDLNIMDEIDNIYQKNSDRFVLIDSNKINEPVNASFDQVALQSPRKIFTIVDQISERKQISRQNTQQNFEVQDPHEIEQVMSESILTNEHIRTTLQDYYNTSLTQENLTNTQYPLMPQNIKVNDIGSHLSRTMLSFPDYLQPQKFKNPKIGPILPSLTKRSAQRRMNLRNSLAQKDYMRLQNHNISVQVNEPTESEKQASMINGTQISIDDYDKDIQHISIPELTVSRMSGATLAVEQQMSSYNSDVSLGKIDDSDGVKEQ